MKEHIAEIFLGAAGAIALGSWALQTLKDNGAIRAKPQRPFRLFSAAADAMQAKNPPSAPATSKNGHEPHP